MIKAQIRRTVETANKRKHIFFFLILKTIKDMAKAMMKRKYVTLEKEEINPTATLFMRVKSPANKLLISIKVKTNETIETNIVPK